MVTHLPSAYDSSNGLQKTVSTEWTAHLKTTNLLKYASVSWIVKVRSAANAEFRQNNESETVQNHCKVALFPRERLEANPKLSNLLR